MHRTIMIKIYTLLLFLIVTANNTGFAVDIAMLEAEKARADRLYNSLKEHIDNDQLPIHNHTLVQIYTIIEKYTDHRNEPDVILVGNDEEKALALYPLAVALRALSLHIKHNKNYLNGLRIDQQLIASRYSLAQTYQNAQLLHDARKAYLELIQDEYSVIVFSGKFYIQALKALAEINEKLDKTAPIDTLQRYLPVSKEWGAIHSYIWIELAVRYLDQQSTDKAQKALDNAAKRLQEDTFPDKDLQHKMIQEVITLYRNTGQELKAKKLLTQIDR